ncbi:hypothetical protein COS75_02540 [Candidatus Pacearchaeota archaeon CG06_land_8_20_14_3_00_35_12]|nr:MAG: hypothetical protein COS75_02540 [Candidatus Pacearchaeota archaeon CG06_land_8_20_14_3_00_35_12]
MARFKGSLAILILAAFLLILPNCLAQSIDSYSAKFIIVDSKTVASYEINLSEAAQVQFRLPSDAKALDVYIDGNKQEVVLSEVLQLSAAKNIKISYVTEKFVEKSKKYYFLTDILFPLDIDKFNVELILPQGAVLDTPNSAWPAPSEITSDGQHIILKWGSGDLERDDSFAIFVIFNKSSTANLLFIISIIVIFIAAAFIFLVFRKKARKEIDKHLFDSEKSVISSLRKANGELWQKQLQIKTGFSKAKLSRIVRNLETRGLIKKIPYGNTNKIRLA